MNNKKPYWDKKWGKDKFCGINKTRLRPGKDKFGFRHSIYLSCGHGFYRKAIGEWFKRKETCPVCRSTIDPVDFMS